MDRIRLLYINYSDWYGHESRTEVRSLEDNADNDQAVWPSLLYALDEKDRCLTAAYYAGRLRVVASEATGATFLLDTAVTVDPRENETAPGEWLFPDDLFDKSPLFDGQKCWCGCAFIIVNSKNICLRCNRRDVPYPKAIKIRCGSETEPQISVNVGGKRIDLPAGYPLFWLVKDSAGATYLILHYQGMDILARPADGVDDTTAFEAVSWSRSGYGREYLKENPDLLLEDFAVRLGCVSQWKERIEIDHLRCDACFRLCHNQIGPCCHCGHAPGEQPERANFLPTAEKIRIVYLGECDHLSMWFRELYDVGGNLYRLYHRGGNMYAFRVEDEFIIFDRKQGGPYDGAGSNEDILRQTADVFELIDQGTECVLCGSVYPDDQVPQNCHVCQTQLRFEDELS